MKNLKKKLSKNEKLLQDYNNTFKKQQLTTLLKEF